MISRFKDVPQLAFDVVIAGLSSYVNVDVQGPLGLVNEVTSFLLIPSTSTTFISIGSIIVPVFLPLLGDFVQKLIEIDHSVFIVIIVLEQFSENPQLQFLPNQLLYKILKFLKINSSILISIKCLENVNQPLFLHII